MNPQRNFPMNITLELEEALCRKAANRAEEQGISVSGWIVAVLKKELTQETSRTGGLLEALAMEEAGEQEFSIPRDAAGSRSLEF